jgi:hypothetical protein
VVRFSLASTIIVRPVSWGYSLTYYKEHVPSREAVRIRVGALPLPFKCKDSTLFSIYPNKKQDIFAENENKLENRHYNAVEGIFYK